MSSDDRCQMGANDFKPVATVVRHAGLDLAEPQASFWPRALREY
jgi:hypothetical protein